MIQENREKPPICNLFMFCLFFWLLKNITIFLYSQKKWIFKVNVNDIIMHPLDVEER